jgi:8-oxo-dGTP pyrophosphatase MutT (NUDIX family)
MVFSRMQSQFDQAEEEALIARYGPTEQRRCHFELSETGYAYWWQTTALIRRAEVVVAVQRFDGRFLLHTKAHYPPDTYRLPTGGIRWGESVLDALAREQWEELGLRLPPVAMPGLIHYTLHHAGRTVPFASYVFVIRTAGGPAPATQDPREPISDFCWIEPEQVRAVADRLCGVIRAWGDWGPFRAIAHNLLAEIQQGASFAPPTTDSYETLGYDDRDQES